MFNIVLFQPELPPNTGNIIRLCANNGCTLHLIEPLGFDLDDKKMRRAGLDYREFADIALYPGFDQFREQHRDSRIFGLTTKGSRSYHEIAFQRGDSFVFGPETRGLPEDLRESLGASGCLRIPMKPDSRSLNLSNAVALVTYEGLRQLEFTDLK